MIIENMENNILTQIYNDPKNEEPKGLFEYVKILCDKYANTINNEINENKYKNAEDGRMLDKDKVFKASEFGMCIDNKELLRVGPCIRKLYFQLTGTIGLPREIEEMETHERNKLVVKQWLNKFDYLQITREPEHKVIEQAGIKIQSTEDAFIYDAVRRNTYVLMIKPVNDTAFSIRDRVFPSFANVKPQILNSHIAEVILNMIILKQPVKLLYVGKNNCGMVQEFNIGVSKQKLVVNGEVKELIDVTSVFRDIKETAHAFLNDMIPPRKFNEYIVNQQDAAELFDLGFVNKKELQEILNGKPYVNFYCNSCRFREVCKSIPKDWCKK